MDEVSFAVRSSFWWLGRGELAEAWADRETHSEADRLLPLSLLNVFYCWCGVGWERRRRKKTLVLLFVLVFNASMMTDWRMTAEMPGRTTD
jgi:hypothetical protein